MENARTLIQQAKDGNARAIAAIYTQNTGLIFRYVHRYECARYPIDDLMQEAYFALVRAVKAYDAESGLQFSTYLGNALRWYFARYIKQDKGRRDLCVLDAPISEDGDATRGELIADEGAEFEAEALERAAQAPVFDWVRQTLAEQEPLCCEVVYRRYLHNQSMQQIAEACGCTVSEARAAMSKAFRALRNPKSKLNRLKDEYVPIFRHVGLEEFKHTQTSAVEWAAMKNEA